MSVTVSEQDKVLPDLYDSECSSDSDTESSNNTHNHSSLDSSTHSKSSRSPSNSIGNRTTGTAAPLVCPAIDGPLDQIDKNSNIAVSEEASVLLLATTHKPNPTPTSAATPACTNTTHTTDGITACKDRPQTNKRRKQKGLTKHNEWIGKPPQPNRKAGQLLTCFHNVDGWTTQASEHQVGKSAIELRMLETREYVQHLEYLEVDLAMFIDTRLDHRESSQGHITSKFHDYRYNHAYHATTATTNSVINSKIGEINTVATPETKGFMVGQPFTDPRKWSRWIGHKFQGPKTKVSPEGSKEHRKLAIIAVYGPCEASSEKDKDGTTRAWHVQSKAMEKIPAAKRKSNPTYQFLHDLSDQVYDLEKDGWEIVIGGDWNIPALKRAGRRDSERRQMCKLFKRGGVMGDVHTEVNRKYVQPPNPIAESKHGSAAKPRHTYQHGTAFTCPDFIIASATLFEQKIFTQCATMLQYHIDSPIRSMHLPTFLTIDLSAAFSVGRNYMTTSKLQRIAPSTPYDNVPKLQMRNKKQTAACTKAVSENTPHSFCTKVRELTNKLKHPLPPHTSFAKHADPEYKGRIADRFTAKERLSIVNCWDRLSSVILKSVRQGCPTPTRKENKVRAWSPTYVKRMHTLRILRRLKHAYVAGKSPEVARKLAKNLTKYLAKAKLDTLSDHPLPSTDQPQLWKYWCNEVDREIALCKKACHHKNRVQIKAIGKKRGMEVERKRRRGEIKQGIRFALRKYRTAQTLTEVTETVPDSTDYCVRPECMCSMKCNACGQTGCEHCDTNMPLFRNYAVGDQVKAKYKGKGPLLSGKVMSIKQNKTFGPVQPLTYHIEFWPTVITGGTKEILHNEKDAVRKAVDRHMAKQFGRTEVSWQTAHPAGNHHPITLNTLAGRRDREELHKGDREMRRPENDDDWGGPDGAFILNSGDKYIHNVFKAFRFKQALSDTGHKEDITKHALYAKLERDMEAPITLEELDSAIRTRAKGKAPGASGIRIEHIAILPDDVRQAFVDLMNIFVVAGECPDAWYRAEVCLIPKEPGATTLDRMRPISLLEIPRKLLLTIKQKLVVDFWKQTNIISPDQYAFISGRSTAEPAMIKKLIAERAKQFKHNIALLDIDLSKAYDSIEAWMVEAALRRMGAPYAYINMLTHFHSKAIIATKTGHKMTDGISPEKGACAQGAIESCMVFLAVMDMGMEVTGKANTKPYMIGGMNAKQIAYCDDATYIVEGGKEDLREVVNSLAAFNHIASLSINYKKSFLCALSWNEDGTMATDSHPTPLQFNTYKPAYVQHEDNEPGKLTQIPWKIEICNNDKHARVKQIPPNEEFRHLGNFQSTLGDARDSIHKLTKSVRCSAHALSRKVLTPDHALYCSNSVIRAEAMYRLKFTDASIKQIDEVQSHIKTTLLNKSRMNRCTASKVVYGKHIGMGLSRWADKVNIERLGMLLHALNQHGSLVRATMLDAIDRLQKRSASNKPVLQSVFNTNPASHSPSSWMLRLWEWMSSHQITIQDPALVEEHKTKTGNSLIETLNSVDTNTRRTAAAMFATITGSRGNLGACNTGDIAMRDGCTLVPEVRNNLQFMALMSEPLQLKAKRTLPYQHRVEREVETAKVGSWVAWVDRHLDARKIRYGKLEQMGKQVALLEFIEREGRRAKASRTGVAAPYATLTYSATRVIPNFHANKSTLTPVDIDDRHYQEVLADHARTRPAQPEYQEYSERQELAEVRQIAEETLRVSRLAASSGAYPKLWSDPEWIRKRSPAQNTPALSSSSEDSESSESDTSPDTPPNTPSAMQPTASPITPPTVALPPPLNTAPSVNPPPPNHTMPHHDNITNPSTEAHHMQIMIGLHAGASVIPHVSNSIRYDRIVKFKNKGETRLKQAIAEGTCIHAYTDASYYGDTENGTYGWVVGTRTLDHFTPLAYGGAAERGANNIARKMSSGRLEKFGLLAAAAYLTNMKCPHATYHSDNTTANKWFNSRRYMSHPLYEWQKRQQSDLDATLHHLMARMRGRHNAVHIKSHVEDRKEKRNWTVDESGNHLADAIAESIYSLNTHPVQPRCLQRTPRTTVAWDGNEIADRLNTTIEDLISEQYIREYMIERPDIWGDNLDHHDFKRMTGHRRLTTLHSHAFHCKFVFGTLATRAEKYKKGCNRAPQPRRETSGPRGNLLAQPQTPPQHETPTPSPLCTLTDHCNELQTNWHVFAQCTHPDLTTAREKWARNTAKVIYRATRPRDDPGDEERKNKKGKPIPLDHTTLDIDIASTIADLFTLDTDSCIDESWSPGKKHSTMSNKKHDNLGLDAQEALDVISKVGARAWWKGSWSTGMGKALTKGCQVEERIA